MILFHPAIDPIAFSFYYFDVRWYSLAYVFGLLIGIYLAKFFNGKLNTLVTNQLIDDFFIWAILGIILGGRTGYVLFYQLDIFLSNPLYLLYIWKGGMSFHGGLFGIIISMFLFSKIKKVTFFELSDLVSFVAPIGLFFGRVANFINVELYGRVTDFPFAMIYPSVDNIPRHPSQLYEAFFEGIILFSIMLVIIKNYSIKKNGFLSAMFLIFYSIFRFSIEFLREPDEHIGLFFNFFTMGQFLCIPTIFLGLLILIFKKKYD